MIIVNVKLPYSEDHSAGGTTGEGGAVAPPLFGVGGPISPLPPSPTF